jgi:hypothetical protein
MYKFSAYCRYNYKTKQKILEENIFHEPRLGIECWNKMQKWLIFAMKTFKILPSSFFVIFSVLSLTLDTLLWKKTPGLRDMSPLIWTLLTPYIHSVMLQLKIKPGTWIMLLVQTTCEVEMRRSLKQRISRPA